MLTTLVMAAQTAGTDTSTLGALGKWVVDVVGSMGVPGVILLLFAENVIPIIPSEVVLPLAGFSAARGEMPLAAAIIAAAVASVAGAFVLYWLGRALGHERTVALFRKVPLVDADHVDTAMRWFQRHGGPIILFGRMVPVIRAVISIPAGIERMPQWRFALFTLIGSTIWNTAFILAGYFLGENWDAVLKFAEPFQYVVIAILLILFAWWLVSAIRRQRRGRAGADAA